MTLTEGCTPLHLAALRLCAPDIQAALRAGDDPNARDRDALAEHESKRLAQAFDAALASPHRSEWRARL